MSVPNATVALLQLAFNLNGNIVNPDTGEIADLAEADLADLVAARAALTDLDTRRKNAVVLLDEELVKRTDEAVRAGRLDQHTYTVGDYKVQVDASTPTRVNGNGLRTDLMRKALAGELSIEPDAVAHMFRTSYTLDKNRWKTQTKLDPALEQIYDQHATPTRRTTTVTRYRPAAINTTSTDVDPLLLEEPPPMVTTDLAPFEPTLPDPVAAKAAMTRYQEISAALLEPDDWQQVTRDKQFVKKSGWTKLAKAYRVSVEFVRETEITRNEQGKAIRASARVRATDPDGRYWESGGACSSDERGRDLSAKPDHDLTATAETRAANRAISNLIGFGEVSAEEMDGSSSGGTAAGTDVSPLDLLAAEARHDVITGLQRTWPGIDAHGYMQLLTSKLETGGIPTVAGQALILWAWWARRPEALGNARVQNDDPAAMHAAWATQQQAAADNTPDPEAAP